MGRPLRADVIEKMGLKASGKLLSKQVGYNKYLVKGSKEIVMLNDVEDLDKGYVVMNIKGKPVLKVLRNLVQFVDEALPYILNDEGKMVIDGKVVSFESAKIAEPVAEEVKEEVAEPVAESVAEPVAEPVAEEVKGEVAEPVKAKVSTRKASK